jgi:hypothetical protein
MEIQIMKHIKIVTALCLVFAICNHAFADTSTMALKNFRAILNSLALVTGVDPTSQDISTYYQQVQAQLPRNGTLSEFNAQTYLASAGLGSVFCSHVITADVTTGKPTAGPDAGIDFSKGPSSITASQRTALIRNYFNEFLQRTPTATEQSTMTTLFAAQTDKAGTVTETQNAILAVCSAVAGSIEFLSN